MPWIDDASHTSADGDIGLEGIQVVSAPKGRVIAHINPGSGAVGMAVAPRPERAWVATIRDGVGIVDLHKSERVGRYASSASPEDIAWDPVTGRVLSAANIGTRRVATIATQRGAPWPLSSSGRNGVPVHLDSVAVDPVRHAAFFANADCGQVWQLDTRTHRVVRKFGTDLASVGSLSVDSHTGVVFIGANQRAHLLDLAH